MTRMWMDETDTEPVPGLDHVYTYMLMELGPPNGKWLIVYNTDAANAYEKIKKIRDAFGLTQSREKLILQYHNWYDREQNRKTMRWKEKP